VRILSYDPGMVNIGHACLDHLDGHYEYRVHGLHVVPSSLSPGLSASNIVDFFENQLRELKPDVVVFEDNFGLPRKVLKGVGKTIGFLELACYYEEVKLVPISPMEWKKALSGSGRCADEDLRILISVRLPDVILSTKLTASHENDALGIGIAYPLLPPISPRQNKAEKAMIKSFIAMDTVLDGVKWK